MNLLFVSEYFPPKIMGGGEINLFLLAKALVKAGTKVSVLTSYHPGLKRFEEMEGIKVYRRIETGSSPQGISNNWKRSWNFPRSTIKEIKIITKKENFTQIHFIGTSIIAASKLKNLNIPFFATIESYPTLCPKGDRLWKGKKECKTKCSLTKFISCQQQSGEIGKMKNYWYLKYNPLFLSYIYNFHKKLKNSLKYCHLIAISEYLQKILLQHEQKSTIIPNAIDVNQFKPKNDPKNNKNNLPRTNKKTNILYLGSLIESKGPQVLLKAIKRIKGLNCRCDLYGEGILKDKLNQFIHRNQLDAEIHAPVPYEKVPELYAQADIVVFPSIWPEPFGRIAIEALAAGKPVIGSRIGGIKETIPDDEQLGLLVEPGVVVELHKALKGLIRDKNSNKKLDKKGEEFVKNNYATKIVIKKLITAYSSQTKLIK